MNNFYVPGIKDIAMTETILAFNKILKAHPEFFYDDIQLGGMFGAIPSSIWDGGRTIMTSYYWHKQDILRFYRTIKEVNLPLRFTFTNSQLTERQLYDNYCNLQLEWAAEEDIDLSIIINSDLLYNYLKKEYPNFKYILSTTSGERDVNKINKACEEYSMVVINYNDNKNMSFLEQLTHPEKIEILVNETCAPNCPYRAKHYQTISQDNACYDIIAPTSEFGNLFDPIYRDSNLPHCSNRDSIASDFYGLLQRNAANNPTVEELYQIYPPLGIHNFKIAGRDISSLYLIESIVYYMAKPLYRDSLRFKLLNIYERNKEAINGIY